MIDKIKSLFRNYLYNKARVEKLKNELKELEPSISAVSYDKPSIQSGKIGDSTFDMAIRLEKEIEPLQSEIKALEKDILLVDLMLSALTQFEQELITEKYIQNKTWIEVVQSKMYSESHIRQNVMYEIFEKLEKLLK